MQYLVFAIQDEDYAIAVDRLEEVLPMMRVRRIPDAPAFLEGAIILRGSLIPVIDLAGRLGISRQSYKQGTRIVVIRLRKRKLGLIIDKVRDIQAVDADFHRKGVLSQEESPFIGGMLVEEERAIQVLVPDHILSPSEEVQLSEVENGNSET